MAKDIWIISNAADAGNVTASSAEPGLGPDRVKDPRMGKVWRPLGRAAGTLTVTFAAPTQIDALAVVTRGWTAPNTVYLRARTAPGGADDVFAGYIDSRTLVDLQSSWWLPERDDPGSVTPPPDPNINDDPPLGPTVAQIVVEVAAGIDVGRVWAGKAIWRPHTNFIVGAEQGMFDQSTVIRIPRTGGVFTDKAAMLRSLNASYDSITAEEWNGPVGDIARLTGASKQLCVVPNWEYYSGPEKHAIIGYQQEVHPIVASGWRRFERSFSILEAG